MGQAAYERKGRPWHCALTVDVGGRIADSGKSVIVIEHNQAISADEVTS